MLVIKLTNCHRVIPCKNGVVLLYKENKHDSIEKGIHLNNDISTKLHKLLDIKDNEQNISV